MNTWLIICLFTIGNVSAQAVDTLRSFSNNRVAGKSPITAFVMIDTVQVQTGNGLIGDLILINNSNEMVSISNPLNYLSMHLMNAAGRDVIINKFPAMMADKRKPKSGEHVEVIKNIQTVYVKVNNVITDKDSIYLRENVIIDTSESMVIRFHVSDMVNSNNDNGTHKTTSLLPAKYRLLIQLSIKEKGVISHLHARPITVRYTVKR